MSEEYEEAERSLQNLSALADGELDAAETMLACARWRGDEQARASWHAYHLIGDVMRSEELACSAARDAAFLRAVRERLAVEPAVLAPRPIEDLGTAPASRGVQRSPRWSWRAPAAVAAGFMAVASVLVVMRGSDPTAGSGVNLAQSAPGNKAVIATADSMQSGTAAAGADALSEPQTLIADGQLVRDARLERYFAAHKQFGGTSALGAPSGFLRAATTQTPDR